MPGRSKYGVIVDYLKKGIQTGNYPVGGYLPSEHELCDRFATTRTTVRRAMEELLKEGYIHKEQGKGSKVVERNKSLGLLTVKGFSGATDYDVQTDVSVPPCIQSWDTAIPFGLTEEEQASPCVFFQRIRRINGRPVVVENNYYAFDALGLMDADDFIEGSFFKTLAQKHFIEIMGAEQELRALMATEDLAEKLAIPPGTPILHVSVRFRTSTPGLHLYGDLYCHTQDYPIRNSYFL